MTHELLMMAGSRDQDAAARRRTLVAHAAAEVPGARSWSVHEMPTATLAVVITDPSGGSAISLRRTPDRITAVLAGSRQAIDTVGTNPDGAELGAEAGHLSVVLSMDGSVRIGTDATGFIPAYWSEQNSELLLSTHLASLVSLGAAPTPDAQGVLEYLVMLHPLLDRTTLLDARMLPAGGRLSWQPGQPIEVSVTRLFVPSSDALSDDEALREFRHVWADIIADVAAGAAEERAVLGLSGGLDSRAIAVESVRRGFRPLTYTYGTRSTREGAVASSVADRLELEHLLIPVTRERMLPEPTEMCNLLDGAHSPGEMYELWFADRLRSVADVVVNGLAGGTLWGDDKALGIGTADGILAAQLARYRPEIAVIRRYLEPHLADDLDRLIRSALEESMRDWDMGERADMTTFWRIYNRQFRWGNMLTNGLRRVGIRTEIPFFDSRFLRFAARLTADQRRNGSLYLRVQREVFAQTARIPRSDDGNAPQHLDHVYWSGDTSYAQQFYSLTKNHPISGLRRGARQARRLGEAWIRDHSGLSWVGEAAESRRSVFASEVWLRTQRYYRIQLADFLGSAPPSSGISADAVEQVVDNLRSGVPVTDALALAKLATLQVWLADYRRRDDRRPSHTGQR